MIIGVRWQDHVRNDDVRQAYGGKCVDEHLMRMRWKWLEHTLRAEDGRIVPGAVLWAPPGQQEEEDRNLRGSEL